jgi:hypothetical protein
MSMTDSPEREAIALIRLSSAYFKEPITRIFVGKQLEI